ncbi:hypothetical protein F2Q69_00056463, partial [Brassica cretica]
METKLPMTSHGREKAVRVVVARIKPSAAYSSVKSSSSSSSSSAVSSVHKPNGDESETVSISFGAQFPGSKDSYKLDYCYEEHETTSLILTKEIEPLISTVFEGKDANVIAHGARGSGKTHLIQGSEKEPGLAVLTMDEMLSMAEERGYSISVSVYEVHVKSLSEFKKLYFGLKKTQKLKGEPPLRSHRGVMIHVTTNGSNVSSGSIGRMNFLDLAGYEDSRKQNNGLGPLETTRINKSIYALQNVMYALNANESHVPYRESKLTRMLKDCLQRSNRTLLITCLGSEKEPGLAVLTMDEMLSMAEERGYSISVSVYEVHVKSLSEFKKLYFGLKKTQKLKGEPPLRSHRGVMIHVTTNGSNVSSGSIGRMNFLDLAGYEDSRKQNNGLGPLETTRINKSIYALQNVMYALNANESHVPYRESKLTRMLKDCLQRSNRTLLITCLPRELSQDSFYMLNLASRICLGNNRSMANATKKSNGPARSISSSSVAQRRQTPLTVTASSKQRTELRGNASERKIKLNTSTSAIKGRKLFGEANGSVKSKNNSKKEVCSSFIVKDSQSSLLVKENSVQALSSSNNLQDTPRKHEERFSEATNCVDAVACKAQIVERDDNRSDTEEGLTLFCEGENLNKENTNLLANDITSQPLSLRLQELSNNLKSICNTSNQPSTPEKYQAALTKYPEQVPEHGDITAEGELRTPERSMPLNVGFSPWKTFSAHSSKLKNSAVGEYLKFLNTADKEDLKKLKGIGEKRATYIVELRQESPEPFKKLDDLKDIGLSKKQ